MTHLFDPALDVGLSHNEVFEVTVQCLTDEVEVVHTVRCPDEKTFRRVRKSLEAENFLLNM